MPKAEILRELTDTWRPSEERHVDLAVRLDLLAPDGSVAGPVLGHDGKPFVIGGRWDLAANRWRVTPDEELDALRWTVQEQQLPAFGIAPEVMFLGFLAGRQSGKSHVGLQDTTADALVSPGRKFGVVSIDYKASREPEDKFRSLLPERWKVRRNKSDRSYEFPHGAQVVFRSAEAIDSLRGPSLKGILLDEAAYMQESVFMAAVGCGAAAQGFRLRLATTPKRECIWIRRVSETWGTAGPTHALFRFRTFDNPLRNAALLEALRHEMPADVYAQEMEGQVVSPPDAVYYLYDTATHVRTEPRVGDAWVDVTREVSKRELGYAADVVLGWDFGWEVVIAIKIYRGPNPQTGRVTEHAWVVGEHLAGNVYTEHHAQNVRRIYRGQRLAAVTDAMGFTAETGAVSTKAQLLEQAGIDFVTPVASKNPDVDGRVTNVLRLLRSGAEETRLYFAPGACPKLIESIEQQRRTRDGRPEKGRQGSGYDDAPDALGYALYALMPTRPGGQTPGARIPGGRSQEHRR